MKNNWLKTTAVLFLFSATSLFTMRFASPAKDESLKATKETEEDFGGASAYLNNIRANQLTGEIDPLDVQRASKQVSLMTQDRALNFTWTELGPDNIGGRTRAFLFDRNDPNLYFAGSVSGGLWKSTTGGSSWVKYNDALENLAVSCITQSINNDIYFGTGEGLNTPIGIPGLGFYGKGVWKSTDNGVTFNRLTATWENASASEKLAYQVVNQIGADPFDAQKVYIATGRGFRMTTDGGATWTNPAGVLQANATDIEVGSDGTVYGIMANKLYKKLPSDNTFTVVNTMPTGVGRIEIAVAPSDPNYLYACCAATSGKLKDIRRSVDGGQTWDTIGIGGNSTFQPLGTQGSYANSIAVDPDNKNTVLVGGLDLYKYYNGSWAQKSIWNYSMLSPYYVHADIHTIKYNPHNHLDIYIGSDGGLNESIDNGETFRVKNINYSVTQFYGVAASPTGDGTFIAGAQDNGTQYVDHMGNTPTAGHAIGGGDGGTCAISTYNPTAFFEAVYYGQLTRSSDRGNSFSSFYDDHVKSFTIGATTYTPGDNAFGGFVFPYKLWERSDGQLQDTTFVLGINGTATGATLCGTVWVTKKPIDFINSPKWYKVANIASTPEAIAVSYDGKTAFVGTDGGKLYRIDNLDYVTNDLDTAGTLWDLTKQTTPIVSTLLTTGTNNRAITSISIDPTNANKVVFTAGNYGSTAYVYRSTNALAATPTFASIQHNLPLMPVYSSIVDFWNPSRIIVGTEMGVYTTEDNGLTWTSQNSGMPILPVFCLQELVKYSDGSFASEVYAATFGRGVFRSMTLTGIENNTTPNVVGDLELFPNPVKTDASIRFTLDKSSAVTVDIFDISGKEMMSISAGEKARGVNTIQLNSETLSNGIYLVRVTSAGSQKVGRMIVAR